LTWYSPRRALTATGGPLPTTEVLWPFFRSSDYPRELYETLRLRRRDDWKAVHWLCEHGMYVRGHHVDESTNICMRLVLNAFCAEGRRDTVSARRGEYQVNGYDLNEVLTWIGRKRAPRTLVLRAHYAMSVVFSDFALRGVQTIITPVSSYNDDWRHLSLHSDSDLLEIKFCRVDPTGGGPNHLDSVYSAHPIMLWNRTRLDPRGLCPETFLLFPDPIRELARTVLFCLHRVDPDRRRVSDALIRYVLSFIGRLTYFVPTLQMQLPGATRNAIAQ
jgi:hypothetical protein